MLVVIINVANERSEFVYRHNAGVAGYCCSSQMLLLLFRCVVVGVDSVSRLCSLLYLC